MRTRNRLTQLLVSSALLLATTANAQVTIGSNDVPVHGALLQLKETNGAGANSKQGLGMPRVKLTTRTDLDDVLNAADKTGNYKEMHTGLTVYHISGEAIKECAKIPDGMYVWDGEQWHGIPEKQPGGLNLSANTLTFYNTNPQSLNVSWSPSGGSVAPPTYAASGFSFTPTSGTWTTATTSPQTISITPTAFPTTPFATNSTTATFTFGACNESKPLTLKQVNKALTIDNSQKPAMVLVTANATKTATLKSNAKWKLTSITPSGTISALSAVKITEGGSTTTLTDGTVLDWENDNTATGSTNNLSYTVTTGSAKARYNYLTFSDANTPKRFADVVLTVAQCTGESDLTMEQYRDLWESLYGIDPANPEPNSNGDLSKNKNKVQWHTDQSGNIFFSAVFGKEADGTTDNRWMITNLAATDFAPDPRTSGDAYPVAAARFNANGSYPSPGAGNNTYLYPVYGYPGGGSDPTYYNKRKRLGLLYNWPAATNSKGGTTDGLGNVDNSGQLQEGQYTEGVVAGTQKRRQGICPNGWHLPSDLEWTKLENEMQLNTAKYSSQTNIGGNLPTIPVASSGYYANIGKPFQDMCEGTAGFGSSNSVLDGGFNTLLGGYLSGSNIQNYGGFGYFASSSSRDNYGVWFRLINMNVSPVERNSMGRVYLLSVRCKKD